MTVQTMIKQLRDNFIPIKADDKLVPLSAVEELLNQLMGEIGQMLDELDGAYQKVLKKEN